jgi:hypothetical protein
MVRLRAVLFAFLRRRAQSVMNERRNLVATACAEQCAMSKFEVAHAEQKPETSRAYCCA